MWKVRTWWAKLTTLVCRGRAERELAREVAAHLALLEDDFRRRGMTAEEARLASRRAMGGVELTKERQRDERSFTFLENLVQNFRHACRSLRHSPGFAAILIGVLGFGIGANTAVFSVLNSILLHPAGIRQPERLVVPRVKYTRLHLEAINLSPRDFGDLRQTHGIFSSATAILNNDLSYTGGGAPVRLQASAVTYQFFEVLGVRPRFGRAFYAEEDLPNRNRVAILSDGLWHRLFGADPAVVGRRAIFNGEPYEIVGVMPPEFQYPSTAELWVPLGLAPGEYETGLRWGENLLVIARLSEGVEFQRAAARIGLLSARVLANEYKLIGPDGWGLFAVPFLEYNNAAVRSHLLILMAAVGLVLLIACSNVAGLMLARASQRSREYAVRIALGASRWHILGQALAESTLVSLGGGAVGLILGATGSRLLLLASPPQFSAGVSVHADGFVLGFTAAAVLATTLLTGIVPGLYMWQARTLHTQLAARAASLSRQQVRSALVVAELALALILLIGAGLFLRSFARLQHVDRGYDASSLLTAQLTLPDGRYANAAQQSAFYRVVLERVRALPGVLDAAWVAALPLTGAAGSGSFGISGRRPLPGEAWPHGVQRFVTPSFLRVLRVPLRKGRFFTESDREGAAPVCVIDELLARRYWPSRDPIGELIDAEGKTGRIIGVIGHVHQSGIAHDDQIGEYLFSLYQQPIASSGLAVKTAGDPLALAGGVREAIRTVDRAQSIYSVRTMQSRIDESLAPRRAVITLLAAFAAFALALAALGICGLVGFSVSQRTAELGLRMALGASPGAVRWMVLEQGVRLAAIGTAAGLIVAAGLACIMRNLLFGVEPLDPLTFVCTSAVLFAIALLASYLPAHRATSIDPAQALRHD